MLKCIAYWNQYNANIDEANSLIEKSVLLSGEGIKFNRLAWYEFFVASPFLVKESERSLGALLAMRLMLRMCDDEHTFSA